MDALHFMFAIGIERRVGWGFPGGGVFEFQFLLGRPVPDTQFPALKLIGQNDNHRSDHSVEFFTVAVR
jgi:hypothetical protein